MVGIRAKQTILAVAGKQCQRTNSHLTAVKLVACQAGSIRIGACSFRFEVEVLEGIITGNVNARSCMLTT